MESRRGSEGNLRQWGGDTVTLQMDMRHRLRERAEEIRARLEREGPQAAKAVGDVVKEHAAVIAAARIEHPRVFGGYLDHFVAETDATPKRIDILVTNDADYAAFVEMGRRPGEPVLKEYKNTPANRRLGRAGASYVHHHTGMPPAGIFGDGEPDWARREKIARDGVPGRFIFRDLKTTLSPTQVGEAIRRQLAPVLFGR